MAMITVNMTRLRVMLEYALKADLVPMVHGHPGIGKSAVMQSLADDFNMLLIDIRAAQCDPTDVNGFPHVDPVTGKASYLPMDIFPLVGDQLPINPKTKQPYAGWILFFDELSSAARAVQAAMYKVIYDRMVGNRRLHPKVRLAAAGNRLDSGAIVEEMSSALQSRMIHLNAISDIECWMPIAATANIDPRITSFLRYKPGSLNTFKPDQQGEEQTFACERTWFFVNRLLQAGLDLNNRDVALPLLAGTIGEGTAREFMAYAKIFSGDLPSIEDICADPQKATVPREAGHVYGICGMLAQYAKDAIMVPIMEYMNRLPLEFQILSIREMTKRHPALLGHKELAKWATINGAELA